MIWAIEAVLTVLFSAGYVLLCTLPSGADDARGIFDRCFFLFGGGYGLISLWWLMWKSKEPQPDTKWSTVPVFIWCGVAVGVDFGLYLMFLPLFPYYLGVTVNDMDNSPAVVVVGLLFAILYHRLALLRVGKK